MLVFSRRRGEAIVVGDGIEIVFLSAGREGVRIGVKAPISVPVHRKEIYEQICEENRQAAGALLLEAAADAAAAREEQSLSPSEGAPVEEPSLRVAVKAPSRVRSGS
jgi:carbon storage regulator